MLTNGFCDAANYNSIAPIQIAQLHFFGFHFHSPVYDAVLRLDDSLYRIYDIW